MTQEQTDAVARVRVLRERALGQPYDLMSLPIADVDTLLALIPPEPGSADVVEALRAGNEDSRFRLELALTRAEVAERALKSIEVITDMLNPPHIGAWAEVQSIARAALASAVENGR